MEESKFNEIVDEVIGWFKKADTKDQEYFIKTPKENLYKYHHTLGRNIRNHFKLWECPPWKEDIRDGVDYSPDHPDAISGRIIDKVWERLTNENGA